MAELTDAAAPLDAEETARLTEFARACKAAARAVLLYPTGASRRSPRRSAASRSITAPAGAAGAAQDHASCPTACCSTSAPPARPDAALAELATLLHSHLIGEMTIHPGGDVEAWRTFLLLLGRSPESVRADGGIARVWTTMAGRHVELREIDYAEVLRERAGGDPAVWNSVIANCLQGSAFDLDEAAIRELLGIAGDSEQLADLMATLESQRRTAAASAAKTAALMRMLRGIVDVVSKKRARAARAGAAEHGGGGRAAARRRCCSACSASSGERRRRRR